MIARILDLPLPMRRQRIDVDQLQGIAARAKDALGELRGFLLEPWPRKQAPLVSGSRVAKLLKIQRDKLNYLAKRGEIAPGVLKGNGRSREYTLEQAQAVVRAHGPYAKRGDADGAVLAVGNFKGGVSKTTCAVNLAQGLTLHGHRVCLIDLDPQASATTLMGYLPDAEVTEDMTVMPVVYGDQPDLAYAPQPTYWPNLDFIPSAPALFGADFFLPNKQSQDTEFQFWTLLEQALVPLRARYDVIVIDTPPTLSYLAIAAFMATDGLVVPVPPETLDYASSTQFFRQFAELFQTMAQSRAVKKEFEFIRIVLSKVKDSATTTNAVRGWIRQTYPELLATAEILESDVVKNASAQFKTIYDLDDYGGSQKAFQRALDAFDAVLDELDTELQAIWSTAAPAQEKQA